MSTKRLYLSRDKVIGGVAGGVANYLGIDPTLVRLIWAFAAFTGAGAIVYIVAMIIIPERPRDITSDEIVVEETLDGEEKDSYDGIEQSLPTESNRNLGVILLIVGIFFLLRNMMPWIPWGLAWPVGVILIGIVYIFRGMGGHR